MGTLDAMTRARIIRFVRTFRETQGQLPTLRNLEDEGFSSETIKLALKMKAIEEFYVTLTTGAIVKGYKVRT